MTNAVGGGLVAKAAFGATVDQGLRTLAGGQLSIQVEGYLAIQTGAAPPLVMEDAHAARDIFAVVREAPSGGAIELQLRQNGSVYCTLDDRGRRNDFERGERIRAGAAGRGRAAGSGYHVGADGGGYAAGTRSDGHDPTVAANERE